MYWMGTLSNITERETFLRCNYCWYATFLNDQSSFGRWRQNFYVNAVKRKTNYEENACTWKLLSSILICWNTPSVAQRDIFPLRKEERPSPFGPPNWNCQPWHIMHGYLQNLLEIGLVSLLCKVMKKRSFNKSLLLLLCSFLYLLYKKYSYF